MIGNKIGKLGEDIAETFLKKKGFVVIEKNYLKKWGEIDIVAKNSGITHFVEVKSVSRENIEGISQETSFGIRPEENLHGDKLKRLSRVIQSYLLEHIDIEKWQFDLCVVYIDSFNKKAEVKLIEDLILPE